MAGVAEKTALKSERLSLQKAFEVFQRQSEMLEKSHLELKSQLHEAHLDLAEKNRQLTATRDKLSGILGAISDAVFLLDTAGGEVEPANDAATDFLTLCGVGIADFSSMPSIQPYIQSQKAVSNALIQIQNGLEKLHCLISVVPVRTQVTHGIVISLKNVTELIQLQKRVEREDRMAALGQVAASVAHEIRNPLAAIEGFGVLLERDLKDHEDQRRLASKTIYAARQLNSVVNNLLSYTREVQIEPSQLYVQMMMADALDFVRPIADDKGIELVCGENCDPMMTVWADPARMRQVLINVLLNAAQACPHRKNGKVRITWNENKRSKSVDLHICDNGNGVPKELKHKIFEPFFTCRDGGTGLGLSLCQRIVEAHSGEILECGKENQGAEFVIRLKRKAVES